jgi:hypothetical protein
MPGIHETALSLIVNPAFDESWVKCMLSPLASATASLTRYKTPAFAAFAMAAVSEVIRGGVFIIPPAATLPAKEIRLFAAATFTLYFLIPFFRVIKE